MLRELRLLVSLQFPQYVRHARACQYDIVGTGRAFFRHVETLEEIEHVVGAAGTRHQRQVGRRLAEPACGFFGRHRGANRLEGFFCIEHEIVDDLLFGQSELPGNRAVAHVLC